MSKLTMLATGELILGMTDSPESYFELAEPMLRNANLIVGHLEVPHTNRPEPAGDIMTPAPPLENMKGLTHAHYSAVTLAGNPTFAYGTPGVADTIGWLRSNGIGYAGAGMNIHEARRPLVIDRDGTRFGFLSYDCVGQKLSAANNFKAGCAYVDIITHYEPSRFPGGPAKAFTWAEPWSLQAMCEDIRNLRSLCDVLTVVLHMGIGMDEIVLADYEFQVPYAAIDAGADLILGNHSHVLKGIEFYKGKAIFHCLGNFVTVFPWQVHRMFQQEPETTLTKSRLRPRAGHGLPWLDLEYPCYPFPPASPLRPAPPPGSTFPGRRPPTTSR